MLGILRPDHLFIVDFDIAIGVIKDKRWIQTFLAACGIRNMMVCRSMSADLTDGEPVGYVLC